MHLELVHRVQTQALGWQHRRCTAAPVLFRVAQFCDPYAGSPRLTKEQLFKVHPRRNAALPQSRYLRQTDGDDSAITFDFWPLVIVNGRRGVSVMTTLSCGREDDILSFRPPPPRPALFF